MRPAAARLFARRVVVIVVVVVAGGLLPVIPAARAASHCTEPIVSAIACENSKPGNPESEWDVSGAGSATIQGFATDLSVDQGQTVRFKVATPAGNYRLDIYRMGYYGGSGARRVATIQPSAALPQNQPSCLTNGATGLVDCGNWGESASWAVPSDAVSGIYFARLVREDGTAGASHVVFVVRDDNGGADVLFQTSDATWQAYNQYGGNSLYVGSPAGRAYKVSYNRPFTTRDGSAEDWVFNAEYPMVRWLEANGYSVSYSTNIDTDRLGAELLEHKVFLAVGHDEYWSGNQRANVEAARAAGVNLAFFTGNEVFWKTRWEPSIDGTNTAYRTLVSYKETHADAKIDPSPQWTGTWRDPRFSPPSDGGRPENALTGTIFTVNCCTYAMSVPEADGKMRFWRNTSVATLAPGGTATLPNGTLGYEWDEDLDNGFRPPGLIGMSTTTVNGVDKLQDFGSSYSSGSATHRLTLYRHNSGALVFGAGTVQWSWGLDSNHDRGSANADIRMQQATVNLLADMATQPATLQAGMMAATASVDTTAPTSTVASPAAGTTVNPGTNITISGTANDTGGGRVGGVEVSTNGGATWRRATGRASWTYTWTVPNTPGPVVVKSRAADDSANLETPSAGVTVTVAGPVDTTPPTVTGRSPAPAATSVAVSANVTATFSEPVQSPGVSLTLAGPGGAAVAGALTFDTTTRTATFNPTADLADATTYTATANATDTAGNAMTAPSDWSFTTAAAGGGGVTCPCTIFAPGATPALAADPDTGAVELGVKFRSDVAGVITGVRFYKGAGNTGTHSGSLWTAAGTRLATATFAAETATGWQQVNFATPVAINANTTYVASYFAPVGRYSANVNQFATAGAVNAPLQALASNTNGGNGVYRYGATSRFPNRTFSATNYWVDVVFSPSA